MYHRIRYHDLRWGLARDTCIIIIFFFECVTLSPQHDPRSQSARDAIEFSGYFPPPPFSTSTRNSKICNLRRLKLPKLYTVLPCLHGALFWLALNEDIFHYSCTIESPIQAHPECKLMCTIEWCISSVPTHLHAHVHVTTIPPLFENFQQ